MPKFSEWSNVWGFQARGTGAVVYPDSASEIAAFTKSLQRAPKASDKESWDSYASRIGMDPEEAERTWKGMLGGLKAEALQELDDVFEGAQWAGYGGPHPFQTKMPRGGPIIDPPSTPKVKAPEAEKAVGKLASAPVSFPYHTKAAREVWEKALELIQLYPLDNPVQILRRAMAETDVEPVMDLTPEDEKLLRMAIEFAQNGPPKSVARIGGAPGGPFRSDDASHTTRGRGAP